MGVGEGVRRVRGVICECELVVFLAGGFLRKYVVTAYCVMLLSFFLEFGIWYTGIQREKTFLS